MGFSIQLWPGGRNLDIGRLPLVESNYHIMELAPKGTGKSLFLKILVVKLPISGGKVTPAQLFINGKTKMGLLGRHDVVVLDEVQSNIW